jgi:mono/diheme cytochrome c family protein
MDTKLAHASGGGGAASGATVAGGTAAGGPPSGTEPQPTAAAAGATAATAGAATPAMATADPLRDFGCVGCHGLDGSPAGGKKGPSLASIKKMDANAIASALVRAHADTNQNLSLGQIRALARELAAAKSGS